MGRKSRKDCKGGENVGAGVTSMLIFLTVVMISWTDTHIHMSKLVKRHILSMCGIFYVNNMWTKL